MNSQKNRGSWIEPTAAGAFAERFRSVPCRWPILLVALAIPLIVVLARAANPPASGKPADAAAVLNTAWTQFYAADYPGALKTVDALADWPEAHNRTTAAHLAARAMFAGGNKQGKEKAVAIWKGFEKTWAGQPAGSDPINDGLGRRMLIGAALQLEAAGKPAEAIKKLEVFLQPTKRSDPAFAEALIELARMYAAQQPSGPADVTRFDDAEKALKTAEDYLQAQLGPGGELNKVLTGPFEARIPKVRKELDAARQEFLNPGRADFLKAEQLRQARKFEDAAKIYHDIAAKHPDSIFADQSNYCIGLCAIGLNQPGEAAKLWEKSISAKPAGPWRGQMFVGLTDLYLEDLLDLADAGKYAELAKSSLPAALGDEKAGESWKPIVYDIQLRVGLVNLCLAKGEPAAEAFEAARKLTSNKLTAEGLDALIAAAKTGKPVIPEDCLSPSPAGGGSGRGELRASPSPLTGEGRGEGASAGSPTTPTAKVALALSMGVIYLCAAQPDKAELYFDRVLGIDRTAKPASNSPSPSGRGQGEGAPAKPAGPPSPSKGEGRGEGGPAKPPIHPMLGSTPTQVAFAIFGEGAVFQAGNKFDEAKEAFLESMKSFPDGTWHDESLYRVATIIQGQADKKFAPPKEADAAPAAGPPPTKSKDQLDKDAKAEKDRLIALLKAKCEALPYWQEILKRYFVQADGGKLAPKSPRCEDALYSIGVLQYDLADAAIDATGKSVLVEKADQSWKEAASTLLRFCESYPFSTHGGDAYVRQIDIALERMFDLATAMKSSATAAEWAKCATSSRTDDPPVSNDAWRASSLPLNMLASKDAAYACFLRAGLVAYLRGEYARARQMFVAAGPANAEEGVPGNFTSRQIGLFLLTRACARELVVSDAGCLAKLSERQQTAVKLADLYLYCHQLQRAIAIHLRICESDPSLGPIGPALEAYSTMQLALAYSQNGPDSRKAIGLYQKLYDAKYSQFSWVPGAIVRLGVLLYNTTRDPRQAIPHFDYVITHYPDNASAERAMFLKCIMAVELKDRALAEKTIDEFMTRFPTSGWRQQIQQIRKTEVETLSKTPTQEGADQ